MGIKIQNRTEQNRTEHGYCKCSTRDDQGTLNKGNWRSVVRNWCIYEWIKQWIFLQTNKKSLNATVNYFNSEDTDISNDKSQLQWLSKKILNNCFWRAAFYSFIDKASSATELKVLQLYQKLEIEA